MGINWGSWGDQRLFWGISVVWGMFPLGFSGDQIPTTFSLYNIKGGNEFLQTPS